MKSYQTLKKQVWKLLAWGQTPGSLYRGKGRAYISTSMLTNPNHVGWLYLIVKKQKVRVCSCFGLAFSCFQYISLDPPQVKVPSPLLWTQRELGNGRSRGACLAAWATRDISTTESVGSASDTVVACNLVCVWSLVTLTPFGGSVDALPYLYPSNYRYAI